MSILVKIGCIFFILSSKNHENRSDLSSRPVNHISGVSFVTLMKFYNSILALFSIL